MKSFLTLVAFVLAVAPGAATSQGAILNIAGLTKAPASGLMGFFQADREFQLSVDYNEAPSAATVDINSSSLIVQTDSGPKTFVFGTSSLGNSSSGSMTITASRKALQININYRNGAAASDQPREGAFSLLISGDAVTTGFLTAESVNTIVRGGSTYTGELSATLRNGDEGYTLFDGSIPVPEPGSIGLLTGLGMVVGRRVWRRRQLRKAEAMT